MTGDTLRVALAQIDFTVGDTAGNVERIESAITEATEAGAELVVCSELATAGYPPRDLLTREAFIDRQVEALEAVATLTAPADAPAVVLGGLERNPAPRGNPLYNVAVLCADGEVAGRSRKRLLPTYDVFDEDRYFERGESAVVHDLDGVGLGLTVCEDAWNEPDAWERPLYDEDPIEDVAERGADLLVNVSASPFHVGKGPFRRELMASHARDHGLPLVFVNQVGATDDLVFDGRSLALSADGEVVARLAEFEADTAVVEFRVGSAATDTADAEASRVDGRSRLAPVAEGRAAQVADAVDLGIRDYFRKTGFEGAVVGLSGGIDSSVTAALAARALGPENVLGVAMPASHTADASTEDARRLAETLGIDFRVIPIESVRAALTEALAPVFEGTEPGVAEENLQARARGTLLMGIANKQDRLVLAPGNKSELAVGYSTLYGDMVGALAPIGDCYKGVVYEVAEWLNAHGAAGAAGEAETVIPERVIEKAPTAELRPDQVDEDDLPPYADIDRVLRAYLDDGTPARALVEGGEDPALVREAVRRLHRAEYKRRQAPPVLKVTEKALGTGWRYPLAARYGALVPDESDLGADGDGVEVDADD